MDHFDKKMKCDGELRNRGHETLDTKKAADKKTQKRTELKCSESNSDGSRLDPLKAVFDEVKEHYDSLSLKTLFEILANKGICPIQDPRLASTREKIRIIYSGRKLSDVMLSYRLFKTLFGGENEGFIVRVLKERLVLKEIGRWLRRLTLYRTAVQLVTGSPLSVSLSSADGQKFNFGPSDEFSLQEMSHVLNYAMALKEFGFERLHRNKILEDRPKDEWTPSNPLTGAGPLFIARQLIRGPLKSRSPQERRAAAKDLVSKLAGGRSVRFDDFDRVGSEKRQEYLKSILNWTNEDSESDVDDAVQYYLEMCGILVDTETLSDMGMTLANGGIDPRTGVTVLSSECVEKLLGVMTVTGCKPGAPALASSSGAALLVLPGVLSLALHSKNRDASSFLLSTLFRNLASDPFRPNSQGIDYPPPPDASALFSSAERGDTLSLAALIESEQVELDSRDYMGRTVLHLAAINDYVVYAEFLLKYRPDLINYVDNAQRTPLKMARVLNRNRMVRFLENWGIPKEEQPNNLN